MGLSCLTTLDWIIILVGVGLWFLFGYLYGLNKRKNRSKK